MVEFSRHYHPLTSRPYLSDPSYTEYPPCEALRPYIACFWESEFGTHGEREEGQVLVVPDTCTDIIIEIDRARQRVTGRLCGLYDPVSYTHLLVRILLSKRVRHPRV